MNFAALTCLPVLGAEAAEEPIEVEACESVGSSCRGKHPQRRAGSP
jgi:hypothetical protein